MSERRLAAVMFTDIVGYSSLCQRNETLAITLLKRHRELLRSIFTNRNGIEIQTIGDAFLVEFPNALDAVKAASEIQKALESYNSSADEEEKILIRIGIHIGDVEFRDGDLYGDGVNIAARLEPKAPPGGICISEAVYTLVHNKVDKEFYRMPDVELKNISQNLVLYSDDPNFGANSTFLEFANKNSIAVISSLLILVVAAFYFLNIREEPIQNFSQLPNSELVIAVAPIVNQTEDQLLTRIANVTSDEIAARLAESSSIAVIGQDIIEESVANPDSSDAVFETVSADQYLFGEIVSDNNSNRLQMTLMNSNENFWQESFLLDTSEGAQRGLQQRISNQVFEINSISTESLNYCEPGNNLEAMASYHRGNAFLHLRNRVQIESAITAFEHAIEIDSDYAKAYEGLALAYFLLPTYLPENERREAMSIYLPLSEETADRALALCDNLGVASFLSPQRFADIDNSFIEIELRFLNALASSPNELWLLNQYASLHLVQVGRMDYSLSVQQRAFENHPNQARAIESLASAYLSNGEYSQALSLTQSLEGSENISCNSYLIGSLAGIFSNSPEDIDRARQNAPERCLRIGIVGTLSQIIESRSNTDQQSELINLARSFLEQSPQQAMDLALWLGENDLVFQAIETANERNLPLDIQFFWAKDAVIANFRQDPRFSQVVEELGLLEYWNEFGFPAGCTIVDSGVSCI